jgi:pimeloyl-ACP methyl ester carboxylesterase
VGVEEPYDLLGQSLGGSAAVVLASERPESVDRLVLGAPPGFVTGSRLRAQAFGAGTAAFVRARRLLGPRLAGSRRAHRVMFAGAISDGARLSAGQARAMIESSRNARRVRAATAAVIACDLAPRLRALRAPLGLIWGERDNTVKLPVDEQIQRTRPGSPLEVISGSGHIPHVEAPDELAAALDRLLARLADPDGFAR